MQDQMRQLSLSFAVGNYDRVRPLTDGDIPIDGVDPIFLRLSPEEIFFRAFRHAEFDVCELSLSSFALKVARGDCPYVGVPAFLSRAFRHTAIYVRTDRGIARPQDLKGRRIGVGEYQLTACVWARGMLEDDHGVRPADLTWVRGGLESTGREEKIKVDLPPDVRVETATAGRSLSQMLSDGEIDAIMSPRPPSCFERGDPNVGWLFPDPTSAAEEYYRRTGIFPIMHVLGVRKDLAARHPWLPATVLKAFTAAKTMAVARLEDNSASKVTLPFVEDQVRRAKSLMGSDFWSYGMEANRGVLDAFLRHHHAQGLSPRRLSVEELFYPSTHESVVV